jgi:hypothetical protein
MKTPNAKHRRAVYAIFDSNHCRWWSASEILAALRGGPVAMSLLDVEAVLAWYCRQGFAVGSGHNTYQYRFLTPKAERDLPPLPSTDMFACV